MVGVVPVDQVDMSVGGGVTVDPWSVILNDDHIAARSPRVISDILVSHSVWYFNP